jgi:hypothetical protein
MNIYLSEVEMLRAECKEWEKVCEQHLRHIAKLKKRRVWVGVDQQDVLELLRDGYSTEHTFTQAVKLIEAVEKKLKEKNT